MLAFVSDVAVIDIASTLRDAELKRLLISMTNLTREMNTPSALHRFLTRWRLALRDRETADRSYWEGAAAVSELQKRGYAARVRVEVTDKPGGDPLKQFIAEHAISEICVELHEYTKNLKRVREHTELRKDDEKWLLKNATRFRTKAERIAFRSPYVAKDLKRLANRIEGLRSLVQFEEKRHWRVPLIERSQFEDIKVKSIPVQSRELDTLFLVRLGAILRRYFPKESPPVRGERVHREITLRTIARLIVLFLVCAEIAEAKDGQVMLVHNKERVSVQRVVQKLRRARLA